jgi:hypothetical protein
MNLHCQLVTTGYADISRILKDFHTNGPFDTFHVWNNSTDINLKVFGRYVTLPLPEMDGVVVYTQDDDCQLQFSERRRIIEAYQPGVIICNLPAHRRPEYTDGVALVGWGAIFDRTLTSVFNLYLKHFPLDDLFLTECDRVFTGLNRVKLIDVPFTHLPHATDHSRMCNRPDHWSRLAEIRRRIHIVKKREGIEVTI